MFCGAQHCVPLSCTPHRSGGCLPGRALTVLPCLCLHYYNCCSATTTTAVAASGSLVAEFGPELVSDIVNNMVRLGVPWVCHWLAAKAIS